MELLKKTVEEFIEEVDSASPAPGGGSVSGLMSLLGISLARMVSHLTIPKKKFQKLAASIQETFISETKQLLAIKNQISPLIDADTEAFNQIVVAFQMPKDTEEELKIRTEAIQNATLQAIKVPHEVAVLSLKALKCLGIILQYGNQQTLSDLGVATLALASGIEGALYNILINLMGLDDEKLINEYRLEVEALLVETKEKKDRIVEEVILRLKA